jgi:hypothetical protein
MEWTLRLVGTGFDGQSRSFNVMPISRPDGLDEIANLGLTLAEANPLLAQVQQQVVTTQAHLARTVSHAARGATRRVGGRTGLRGQGEASPDGVCRVRLWQDQRQLAIPLPLDPWARQTASAAVSTDAVSSRG